MNIAAYPNYKKTGVEWLGDIPTHWEVRRLKFLAEVCNGQDQKEVLNDDGKYLIFGSGGPFGFSTSYLYDQPSVLLGRKGTIDKPLYIEAPFWTVDTMFYTRIESRVFPKYFFYLCKTIPYDYVSDLTTLPSMTQTGLGGVQFAFVEYEEQQRIAAFLDWKTSQIDALIAKKQTLLQKLKEKRLAVITQAVTKGLNPDAPMRDSGIAWLGEVPTHWQVMQLRRRWEIIDCKHKTVSYVNDGIPMASIQEVHDFEIDLSRANLTTETEYLSMIEGGRKPELGDIIYSRNATVGDAAIVTVSTKFCMGQDVCLLRSQGNLPRFVAYLLRSYPLREQAEAMMIGSTFHRINVGQIKELWASVPPMDEQIEIAIYLDAQTKKIDAMVSNAEAAISRLTEYRSALITAATTGKIDVRNVAIPAHA